MRRFLFRILNLASILLLAASVFFCVYGIVDGRVLMRRAAGGIWGAGTTEGWATLFAVEYPTGWLDDEIGWDVESLEKKDLDQIGADLQATTYRLPGITLHLLDSQAMLPLKGPVILIHFAWLIVLFSILPAYWLLTRRNTPKQRLKLGLCVQCGYDLRGSTGAACPECGEPLANRAAADVNHTPSR